MLFVSVSYVSIDFAGLCSFHNIILEIIVVTFSLGRVASHVDHLIGHPLQQLRLGFQEL